MANQTFAGRDDPGPTIPPPPGPNRLPADPYKFSEDELKVLRECNRDSFFQRCVPIGTLFGTAAYYGVKSGYLKPSARYGPTPKVVVSVIIGYFVGKISYQRKCAEKLMQLPDSKLGEMLRRKKYGNQPRGLQDSLDSFMPFSGTNSSDVYSDVNPNGLDMDTTRPDHQGLDDYHRPSVDNPVFDEEIQLPPKQKETTTYEELRRKNREQYAAPPRTGNYTPNPNADVIQVQRPTMDERSPPNITNKYGDVME